MKYKKLRKNVKNKDWFENRLLFYAKQESDNEWFKDFQCDPAFNGYTLARINKRNYLEKKKFLDKKIRQIEYFLERLNEKE